MTRAAEIYAEMAANGFAADRRLIRQLGFEGQLDVRGRLVSVAVTFADATLRSLPKLRLLRRAEELPGLTAHIEAGDRVCYLREQDLVLDPLNVRGTVALCLIKMREALARIAGLDLTAEIAAEFPQHWQGSEIFVDLPESFAGTATVWRGVHNGHVISICSDSKQALRRLGLSSTEIAGFGKSNIRVLWVPNSLTFVSGQTQPKNLAELLGWTDSVDPSLAKSTFEALASDWPPPVRCLIHAPNGTVGVELELPRDVSLALKRPAFLKRALALRPTAVALRRLSGQRIDARFIFERNMDEQPNLTGKFIAIVGCGTIGGYLAKLLAQSGAGYGGGQLLLIDEQTLSPGNIGRHYLSGTSIGSNKAEALRDELRRAYSDNRIEAWAGDAGERFAELAACDLVVDATGDQAFSDTLNLDFVGRRQLGELRASLLHVWLVANGVAAQALFYDGSGACIRCLRLDGNDDARFPVMRADHPARIAAANCGEGSYFAYGPAAPAIAAGLATQLCLDWRRGHPAPHFRTLRIVQDATMVVKDGNPARRERCPACGRH